MQEQEIFDEYCWNEHKKILTADWHKIPGSTIYLTSHQWPREFQFRYIIILILSKYTLWSKGNVILTL